MNASIAPGTPDFSLPLEGFETEMGASLVGCTVIRIRGRLAAAPVASSTGFGTVLFGVRTVDRNSFATLGNDDGPLLDDHADWMLYESLLVPAGGSDPRLSTQETVVDVRSMRKIEELGRSLLMAVAVDTTAESITVAWSLSYLIKLP